MFHRKGLRCRILHTGANRRPATLAGSLRHKLPPGLWRLAPAVAGIALAACAGMNPPGADASEAALRNYCRSLVNAAVLDAPGAAGMPGPRTPSPAVQLEAEAVQRDCLARYGLTR